jgi:hypothetical protein
MASKNPRGVFLPVRNLHFIKDKKGVKVSARCGRLSPKKLRQLIRFLKELS